MASVRKVWRLGADASRIRRAIQQGTFREDVCYRLAVITVTLPPLRERIDDVPALAQYFLKCAVRMGIHRPCALSDHAVRALQQYQWPGNIRELDNVLTVRSSCVPRTHVSPRTCIWQIHRSPRRPRPRQALLPVTTMRAWTPAVGRSLKRRCAEMDGTKPEHPKSSAFNGPTSRNCSVRKTSLADSP